MKTFKLLLVLLSTVGLTSSHAQNTWTQKADFGGIARSSAATFSIGDKGYLGTGCTPTVSILFKDFWEYDPATDTWTQKADFGGGERAAAVGLSINGKGYIGTGFSGSFWGTYYNDFWEYDPVTNVWTKKADFGGVPRSEAGGFTIGDKGYIGTGFTYTIGEYYSDFWEYDPASDVWTKKADFGGGDWADPTTFSIDNKGYMGTGWKNGLSAKFYEYDPATDTWTQKANYGGGAIQYSVGFSIGSKGYIGTGVGSAVFYEYDPDLNMWTKKADYGGGGVNVASGFSIGNKGYIGTGQTNVALKSFWEYTPDCNAGITVYLDADADGYGDVSNNLYVTDCVIPNGYVSNSTDCNDANATVHPDACDASNSNGIDDNCDGIVDNDFGTTTYFADVDGDGYGAGIGTSLCNNPGTGYSTVSSDCNDNNAAINPVAYEIIGDGIDNNCNGIIDEDVNNALNFDGVNDYVEKNITSLPLGNAPRTLETWIRTTSYGSQVFFNWGTITTNQRCGIMLSGNKLYFVGENNDAAGTIPINDGQWHHVAITFDGVHLKGYVDGVLDINTTKTLNTVGTVLRIGRRAVPQDGEYLNGSIDEVRIWNVARTQEEIQADMNLSICGNTSDLIAYYPLNQGFAGGNNTSIVTAHDITANNNEGALKNFSLTGSSSNWVTGAPDVVSALNATYYQDADGDGYGNSLVSQVADCTAPSGYILDSTDCDDNDGAIYPGACDPLNGNGIDDNCDGIIDNGFGATTYYPDGDGDGYGAGIGTSLCNNPGTGYPTVSSDCNDNNADIHLGTIELVNGIDDDCNGIIDDIAQNTWTQKADFGGGGRSGAVGFSIADKGYIGTGYDGSYKKDFWEYDPATNTWTQKADFGGTAREGAVGFSIADKGYVGTGEVAPFNYTKDFWEYTPKVITSCLSPTNGTTTNITGTSAELHWDDLETTLGYVIKYNTDGGDEKAKVTYSKSNSKPISELTPNTTYFWRVKSVCSEDPKVVSDWSEKQYFTTAPFKVSNLQATTLELYPNPVADQFTLHLQLPSLSNQAADIFLLNTLGQVIYSTHASAGNGALNQVIAMPAAAAAGWYVVKVVMSDQVMERKLLYQQ